MFYISSKIVTQKNEFGVILLNMDNGEFYSLYDVAADVWGFIEKQLPKDDILEMIIEKYTVSREQATIDVENFFFELQKEALVLVHPAEQR